MIKQHKKVISYIIDKSLAEDLIDGLAKETGFMQRKGKVPPSCFVNTLLFSENDQAHTSLPDLIVDLNQAFGIDISKVAMHKKFTPEAVEFLKRVIRELLCKKLKTVTDKGLLLHFPRIKIKDSTKFALPDSYGDAYKGFGNFSKTNGLMSLQYEYDIVSGEWLSIEMTKGLRNDQMDSKETIAAITKGDLHIRDLGYITPTYLSAVISAKGYFLNRLPAIASVFTMDMKPLNWKKINTQFKNTAMVSMETDVMVYESEKIPCRLIIERVNKEEYKRRLDNAQKIAKGKGVGVSALHKLRLQYNTIITNVSADILPMAVIRKTYYLRWQIELVFKTWKSYFHINMIKMVKKERLECQLLAKLMWILVNWQLFRTLNNHVRKLDINQGVSILNFFKRCIKFGSTLRLVIIKKMSVCKWIEHCYLPLIIDCVCEAPKNKHTHYQSLKVNIKPFVDPLS